MVKKMFGEEEICDEKFDVLVLNKLIFEKILSVDLKNVSYCCCDKVATNSVDVGDAYFCIYLNAIRGKEFFDTVKSNKKLPKRCYSFFPNPVEGLLFYVSN